MNLTNQAFALFNLLPTTPPHVWLIAADWIQEQGKETDEETAEAFREGIWVLEPDTNDPSEEPFGYRWDGSGWGDGWASGVGHGDGAGYAGGAGSERSYGSGYGLGSGEGSVSGKCNGHGCIRFG